MQAIFFIYIFGVIMTKLEFIKTLVEKSEKDKKTIDSVISAIDEIVKTQLALGQSVPFGTLGTFKVTNRQAREIKNPITGETIHVPEKTVVKFGVSKLLKEMIANSSAK
jgi:DNA-binding protein HU-beta